MIAWLKRVWPWVPKKKLIEMEVEVANLVLTISNRAVKVQDEMDEMRADYEKQLALKDYKLTEAWGRWQLATSISQSYGEGRVKIIRELERFGMALTADDTIVVHGPKMTPAIIRDGVMVRPPQMIPILASGLEQTPQPPYEGDLVPIICWYRLVPDPLIKGQINEEYSHFEDAVMTLQDPKNRKNKKMIIKLPTEMVPPPRGGTKFSGKWVWHQKFRTQDQSPRVIEQ